MIRTKIACALVALTVAACGGETTPIRSDSGTGGVDSGMGGSDSGPRPDSGPGSDSGPGTDSGGGSDGGGTGDPCAASMASQLTTLGCNGGFASGEPAPNGPDGACTPDAEDPLAPGSCTLENSICFAGLTSYCMTTCPRAETYVSTGACPTGYRCFQQGVSSAYCFRDCDDTHECPYGWMCEDGGCIPAE
jgi:hypothetical protein